MIPKHSEKLDFAILCMHNFNKPLTNDFLNIFSTAMSNMGPALSNTYLVDIQRLIEAVDKILLDQNLPSNKIIEYQQIKKNLYECRFCIPVYKKIF